MKSRQQAYRTGLRVEKLALIWLLLTGFRIIATRYKTPGGEIDIVARRGRTLVVLEVKYRKQLDEALYSVPARNRHRIVAATRFLLASRQDLVNLNIRFDVMVFARWRWPQYIKAAFDSTDSF